MNDQFFWVAIFSSLYLLTVLEQFVSALRSLLAHGVSFPTLCYIPYLITPPEINNNTKKPSVNTTMNKHFITNIARTSFHNSGQNLWH